MNNSDALHHADKHINGVEMVWTVIKQGENSYTGNECHSHSTKSV